MGPDITVSAFPPQPLEWAGYSFLVPDIGRDVSYTRWAFRG